ncbi:cytochrome P450 [Sistotremastrum suecicum HHB10207 ss-3]|uniref:Cytochrome P450 n=1 Tax=Sistotremastrum suecicum HHB10207 ss-3 TaxID=1314776 RepID=A0A166EMW5_9AGAM|nr:cytochrome P450 [Sistotremastrum suecicum HHB10207 ss-3]
MSTPLIALVLVAGAVCIVQQYVIFRSKVHSIRNWHGLRVLLNPVYTIGNVIPYLKGVSLGANWGWTMKHQPFVENGWNVLSVVAAWPAGAIYYVADADAVREITLSNMKWPKPLEQYGALAMYGSNVVITEGKEWKRHRKISAPAFSERNNRLVFDAAVTIMDDLYANVWGVKESVDVDHCLDLTLPIALMVLSVAGFGKNMSWAEDGLPSPGRKLPFTKSLAIVSRDIIIKVLAPTWALGLTKRLRETKAGYEELGYYMQDMIRERKGLIESGKAGLGERADLLTNLLAASEEEGEDALKLTNEELTGNIFIYLVAGHETTAHTLCYTLGMLALYPDEQEKLYQHVKSVIGDRRPTYDDFNALDRVLACFYETLRMFPPVCYIPKKSGEDLVLPVSSSTSDERKTLHCPKGTAIVLDTPALHYNPKYWKDPYVFNPERFLEDYNKDAFIPFSGGARACIGRRFSETEAVAVISMLVSKYTIHVMDEPKYKGESIEQTKERIFKSNIQLTLTPDRVPLTFKRR